MDIIQSHFDPSLRKYQQEAKDQILSLWKSVNNLLYQMPTGTGKTRLFSSIIRDLSISGGLSESNFRILIIAHRTELIDQTSKNLLRYRVPHGIIAGAFPNKRNLTYSVQVASIQTITHSSNLKIAIAFDPSFIIIDEAHHVLAKSYQKLWQLFPNAKKLGVTATPWRMDGRGFTQLFDKFIHSMSIKQFIKGGWLANYDYYSVALTSNIYNAVKEIKEFGCDGDYKVEALERVMNSNEIRAQLVDSYLAFAKGKKGIIYSVSKYHSKLICDNYRAIGVNIVEISGSTPTNVRQRLVEEFKKGEIDIIVNVDIFSEGFDCPSIEFIQLARPTRSLVKYLQQIGRGLRINGNKRCIILDNVGSYAKFGLPDADRDWYTHFIGTEEARCKQEASHNKSICSINQIEQHKDLSEGSADMVLIQSDNVEQIETSQNSPHNQIIRDKELNISNNVEICSERVFSKYVLVNNKEGLLIKNIRTSNIQFLKKRPERVGQSMFIKLIRIDRHLKQFTVYVSYNRNKNVDNFDIPLGILYKEGVIIKFKDSDNESTIKINV